MPRYIDADALLEEQGNLVYASLRNGKTILHACKNYLKAVIDDAPTADVAPVVHGRWETDKEDIEWGNSLKRKYCTNCGKRPHFDKEKREFILSDYCPNCGAKMDLED